MAKCSEIIEEHLSYDISALQALVLVFTKEYIILLCYWRSLQGLLFHRNLLQRDRPNDLT